jgi:hypothetical protein
LGERWDAPAPVVINALSAECQPSTDDSANVPQAVVDGGDTSTMLRMADLGEKERRRELGKGVAETHEETTAHEVTQVLGCGLDGGTDNHDDTSCNNASLAAVVVGNERNDWKRGDGTDCVESSQETKSGLGGMPKVVLPVVEDSKVVQHGSVAISFDTIGKTVS